MIEFRNVTFAYEKEHPVISDISFTVKEGESVGLIGANGAGKSTVMKLILGLLEGEGDILIKGIRCEKKNLSEIRSLCGLVLQNSDDQMFMPTVCDDMMFGPLNAGMKKEEAEKITDTVLEQLQITYLKNRYNHRISGGEKRMAAIAAVLSMSPEILLMDEPFSALDLRNRTRLQSFMKTFLEDTGMTSVIVTHSIEEALCMGDRVAVFDPERGRIRTIREGCRQETDPDPAMLDERSRRIRESLLQMQEAGCQSDERKVPDN